MELDLHHLHPWEVSPQQAVAIQLRLKKLVKIEDDWPARVETVAGVDVAFQNRGQTACAAVAVLAFPSLELVASTRAQLPAFFPYIPGLLSFRELPAVLAALEKLPMIPDLILCDGQGIAHPRRLGIASHLGVLLDHPTIGVGKTRLVGRHDPVPDQRGAWVPLIDRGETVGAALRTREGVKPIYVSPGHRISLPSAVSWVMACTRRFRLPEATRLADRLSRSADASQCSGQGNNTQEDSAAAHRRAGNSFLDSSILAGTEAVCSHNNSNRIRSA
ncbi:MAG: deoxyribonuclease V [Methylohalobius sp.]|nr:deoxyribonuclease V [Methylohalobius sp.]